MKNKWSLFYGIAMPILDLLLCIFLGIGYAKGEGVWWLVLSIAWGVSFLFELIASLGGGER